jgi:hypothetical protein
MSRHTVVDPSQSDDETWCSHTGHVKTDENTGFVAVWQGDDKNRSDDVGYKPGSADVSSVIGPSLEGEGTGPNGDDFHNARNAAEKCGLPRLVTLSWLKIVSKDGILEAIRWVTNQALDDQRVLVGKRIGHVVEGSEHSKSPQLPVAERLDESKGRSKN